MSKGVKCVCCEEPIKIGKLHNTEDGLMCCDCYEENYMEEHPDTRVFVTKNKDGDVEYVHVVEEDQLDSFYEQIEGSYEELTMLEPLVLEAFICFKKEIDDLTDEVGNYM